MTDTRWPDPYPLYDQLRGQGPVVRNDALDAWLVVGLREARELLRSSKLSSAWSDLRPQGASRDPVLDEFLDRWFLLCNDPVHLERRGSVQRLFTRKVVEANRKQIVEQVVSLIDSLHGKEVIDLVADYAAPLSMSTLATAMNMNVALIQRASAHLEPLARYIANPFNSAFVGEARQSTDALNRLLTGQHPADEGGVDAGIASLLMFAGLETSRTFISTLIMHLLENSELRRRLIEGQVSVENIVRESLRIATPAPQVPRVLLEDYEIGELRMSAGDRVVVYLDAANHDPEAYACPHEYQVDRTESNLAFGGGPHYCLGSHFALVIAEEAALGFVRSFPRARLRADHVRWRFETGFRSVEAARVELGDVK